MFNYESWLKYIKNSIENKSERYNIIDDEHVLDLETGIKLHIYTNWFKVTHDDKTYLTMGDFCVDSEQPIIWQIKKLITDPEKYKDLEDNYMERINDRRVEFERLLKNPVAINNMTVGDEEYTG